VEVLEVLGHVLPVLGWILLGWGIVSVLVTVVVSLALRQLNLEMHLPPAEHEPTTPRHGKRAA
jgi:hypothetical protein